MKEFTFNQIYDAFFTKRSLPTSLGLEDEALLIIVLDELKTNVDNVSDLLGQLVVEFSKRKLPSKIFSRYNKLSIRNLLLSSNQIFPEPLLLKIKLLNNSFDEIIKSLSKVVAKDTIRPVMEGVFLNSKQNELVGTDANMLISVPYMLKGDSIIINPKTNLKKIDKDVKLYKGQYEIVSGNYPNYQAVIPNYNNESKIFELIPFLNHIRALEKLSSFFVENGNFVVKLVAEKQILFIKPALLSKLLMAMAEQGVLQFRFQWADDGANSSPILLKTTHSKKMNCLIMPYMLDEMDKDYAFMAFDLVSLNKPIKKPKAKARQSIPIRKKPTSLSLTLKAKSIKLKLQLLKL